MRLGWEGGVLLGEEGICGGEDGVGHLSTELCRWNEVLEILLWD